ncbi:hypothetical protein PMAYCL1PPCAC_04082, partial [Pristionchus mayeri]
FFHVRGLACNAFLIICVIVIWTILVTGWFGLSLTEPAYAQLPPARRVPIRAWSKKGTNETIHFKDAPFSFRILQFPEALTSLCASGNLTFLAVVQTSPASVVTRNAIRETWADPKAVRSLKSGSARVVFLIGDGGKASKALLSEIKEKKDIILVDTEETYKNLAFKTAITLFISHTHCPTPFLLKIDQDVAFAVDRFLSQVGSAFHVDHSSIYCRVRYRTQPYRQKYSRWYVSEQQYSASNYPQYCAGPAYVLTAHAVDAVMRKLPEFELIKVEDVFFTGLVASASGVRRVGMQAKFKTEYWKLSFSSTDCSGLVLAIHNLKTEQEIGSAWAFLTRNC